MPSTSEAQARAMHAAAEGHSTLGIPASVGAEFVAADERKKHPMRRRKRGKRGGKKRLSAPLVLAQPDAKPSAVPSLRDRLKRLATKGTTVHAQP